MAPRFIGIAVGLACASACLLAGASRQGRGSSGPRTDGNLAELADLDWVSRDANCWASSATPCEGKMYWPVRALLTGDDPNAEEPGRRTIGFHTECEQDPYIVIMLPEPRDVGGFFIENLRYDPCIPGYDIMFQRTSSMAVWVSADGASWEKVWQAKRAEAAYTVRLAQPRRAQYVKMGLQAREYFHLSSVRVYATAGGVPTLTRLAEGDRVLLRDGTVLVGKLEHASFSVRGVLGKVDVLAARLAGIVPDANAAGLVRLVLEDGQVLAGAVDARELRLRVTGDSNQSSISWAGIRQVGCRMGSGAPAATRGGLLALLRSGDRFLCASIEAVPPLETGYGRLELPLRELAGFEGGDANGGPCRIRLRGGSCLSGTLAQEKVKLAPRDFPPVAVDARDIRRIQAEAAPATTAFPIRVHMRNGDTLAGRATDAVLTLRTGDGESNVLLACVAEMSFDPSGEGVTVTMWDGARLVGRLAEANVPVAVTEEGGAMAVRSISIRSMENSRPMPPPEVRKTVESLIAALGSSTFKEREEAMARLAAMGKSIGPLLEAHREDADLEVRTRVAAIIEQLTGESRESHRGDRPTSPPPTE